MSRHVATTSVRVATPVLVATLAVALMLSVAPVAGATTAPSPTTAPAADPTPSEPSPSEPPPSEPEGPPYDGVVDITFPVAGPTSFTDDYAAPRGGGTRVHKATDVMAPYGVSVHAAVGGVVSWITGVDGPVPSYGYMITVAGDDGRSYSYIHLGRQDEGPSSAYAPGIARGVRVERGQHIAWNGCSGNASCSAPHLHFQISDPAVTDPYGTTRMNPYASLLDAQGRGDLPTAVSRPVVDTCAPTAPVPVAPVRRVAASDPVTTSVAVSGAGWPAADRAVVATADDFADALAGAAVAAEWGAPLLLVGDELAAATREELRRLGVARVTILGGPAAVGPGVEDVIAGLGVAVDRMAGSDRFATAAAIRSQLRSAGAEVALALGRHATPDRSWPDAISAGALAGGDRTVPVLLSLPDALPDVTRDALRAARDAGARTVLVIGGPAAIDPAVDALVADLGLEVRRLQGDTRYETSVEVAKAATARGAGTSTVVIASGESFADALPAGPLAARVDGTLVLVPPCTLDTVKGLGPLLADRYRDGYVVGAPSAVSERVREVLTNAMGG